MPSEPTFPLPDLLDGAMGTELLAAGLPLGHPAEDWVLRHPERIRAVHRAYVQAGAGALTTATFGATAANLARHGLEARADEINRRAVELARAEATPGMLLAGNLGPLVREATAPLDAEHTLATFRAQGEALARAEVDLFLVETMTDLREAVLAVQALQGLRRPIACSFTVGTATSGGVRLLGGAPLAEAVQAVTEAGACVIGLNCMLTPAQMRPAIEALRSSTELPLLAQPNAGQPRARADGGFDYEEGPEHFAEGVARLRQAGAHSVGGCCGSTPAHIAKLRFTGDSSP